MNLRLSEEAAGALREAAQVLGRSQQQLLREAVDRFLGLNSETSRVELALGGWRRRPTTEFQDVLPSIDLPKCVSTADLLDREGQR